MRVTVVGAGNAGYAMAGDLSLAGVDVCLYELPEFSTTLAPLKERGGIEVTAKGRPGWRSGFARVSRVTTDIKEALDGADCVFIVTVSLAHERLAEMCAPHLTDGQALVLCTAYAGSPIFRRALRRLGARTRVLIGETVTLPYYCRLIGPALIDLRGTPYKILPIAAVPAQDTPELVARVQPLYPFMQAAASVLEVMLLNPNVIRHTVPTILNIGRIEYAQGEFWIFREGWTKSVWRVFDQLDHEKMAIMNALGLQPLSYRESRSRMTDYTLERQGEEAAKGPASAEGRYLSEDVPNGLVPRAQLGERLGVPVPTHTALIHLASVINGRDYVAEGRTLSRLGLAGVAGSDLREVFDAAAFV